MSKKLLSLLLVALVVDGNSLRVPASSSSERDKQEKFAAKVKDGVKKLGVGADARVTVRLRDKRKLAGYVSGTGEESFTITDSKSGEATTVAYAQVAQVKGHNLSSGAKIAIGVAIIAAILIIAIAVAASLD